MHEHTCTLGTTYNIKGMLCHAKNFIQSKKRDVEMAIVGLACDRLIYSGSDIQFKIEKGIRRTGWEATRHRQFENTNIISGFCIYINMAIIMLQLVVHISRKCNLVIIWHIYLKCILDEWTSYWELNNQPVASTR